MSPSEWTAIAGLVIALLGVIFASIRFIVKAIMQELSPNSGKSLKDQVTRIESRLDHLILELATRK